ncbi:sodium:proton antiporter NhaD [Bacteroidota bacterium]
MFILMVIVFVLGYIAIALEHPLKIDKAATALLIGTLTWTIYILGVPDILELGFSNAWHHFLESSALQDFLVNKPDATTIDKMIYFVSHHETTHHLAEASTILFFLLGAMTIVEIVDQHQGFKIITDKIKTTDRIKLLWILSFLTFFMSAALDNLTTTIVMVALLRKLVANKKERWFMAGMIILAANAGGAWSPIGDVTTIMLWIGGQVTTLRIIIDVFLPSMVTMLVPLIIVSVFYKKYQLKVYPESTNALFFLAETLRTTGELESAVQYYKRFLNLMNEDVSFVFARMEQTEKIIKSSASYAIEKIIRESGIIAGAKKFKQLKLEKDSDLYFDQREINLLGYKYLNMSKITEAIEIFKMNVILFPESANVYDSIAEAYMKQGDKKAAIKNYRKVIELDAENKNAKDMLIKLKK